MHLFFYGVLRPDVGRWPFLAGLGPGSPATTTGALYAIPNPGGWFPALVRSGGDDKGIVHGVLHSAGSVDLEVIDAFEGPDYTRMDVPVAEHGAAPAQAYVWTAALPPAAQPITHGDFARWLEETGGIAFGHG